MAMLAATLATGLAGMTPTDSEAAAIDALTAAWESYFSTAAAGPVPYTAVPVPPETIAPELIAFKSALTGMSADGAGAQKIQDAMTAFWSGMIPAAAFAASTAITAPTDLSAVVAALAADFISNKDENKTLPEAAAIIAATMHTNNAGGIATFPPPPGGIGPQTIV